MNGVFLINKEENWTSFDICAKLRRVFATKKVGHSGTLDPFAEGLMLVCLGQATKVIPFLENYDKEYEATLYLGKETDTLDKTGTVINEKDVLDYSIEEINDVLKSFLGKINQVPPMYSALKKDGLPLYYLARMGVEVERKSREVEIFSIELISYQKPYLKFKVHVSKGTYIRSLGLDIARKLNTVGHLVELKRTKIGKFNLNQSKKVTEVTENDKISIVELLSFMETITVDDKMERDIRNGVRLSLSAGKEVLLKNKDNIALAIYYQKEDGYYYTKRGLFDANNNI